MASRVLALVEHPASEAPGKPALSADAPLAQRRPPVIAPLVVYAAPGHGDGWYRASVSRAR